MYFVYPILMEYMEWKVESDLPCYIVLLRLNESKEIVMDDENHIRLWQNVPTLSQLNTFAIRKYTNPLENV